MTEELWRHPLSGYFNKPDAEIDAKFPIVGRERSYKDKLLLQPFVRDRPQKFFDDAAFQAARTLISEATPAVAARLTSSTTDEVQNALRFLRTVNANFADPVRIHDSSDVAREHRLHTEVFAEYSRVAEHVYGGLLAFLLEFKQLLAASGKTVPSDLRPRWEMAKGKKNGLPPALTSNYNPTVRNAIIHGGVTFNVYDVTFRDKNGDEAKLSFSEAERLAQRLLNVCNGIVAALVESLVDTGTLVQQLTTWVPTETAAALASAPLLTPEAIYLSQYAELQAQMHGRYSHWRSDDLLFDLSRAALALHAAFPQADRYFLSFRPLDRGAPSFFTIPRSDIPQDRSSLGAIYALARTIMDGQHGMLWVDPPHLLAQLFSKTRFGRVLNWNQASDLGTSAINFELRELRNTSVDRKSRFEAYVVSSPRAEDLDDEFHPTVSYLKDLFTQTGLRWLLRAGQRPFGVKHLRIFDFATIYVYAHDRPRQDLRGSGLPEYLMFRAQYGKNIGPPFLGSSWVKRGPFFVTMNPAGLSALKRPRQA